MANRRAGTSACKEPPECGLAGSERDLVVHVAALAAATGQRRLALRGRAARTEIVARVHLAAAAAAAGVEHCERRVEALQHHLGGIFLDAVLVGVLAGLQLTLEIN